MAVDSNIDGFQYSVELKIDPPLPDNLIKGHSGGHFSLRQNKDEDVKFIDGEIVVVSNNITEVYRLGTFDDVSWEYKELKKELAALAKSVKSNKSQLDGQVVVMDRDRNRYLRLLVKNCTVSVEAAETVLGWPDGTHSPLPKS